MTMEAAGLYPAEINMGLTEILLIIFGAVAFVASFLIPEKLGKENPKAVKMQEEKIKELIEIEMKQAAYQIEEKTDETVMAVMEKTERYMERLTNEKIMAVQEYSDTVLGQINRNHEEAVFLYDMLNNKHVQVKNTAAQITQKVEGIKTNFQNSKQEQVTEFPIEEVLEKNMYKEEDSEKNFESEELENYKENTVKKNISIVKSEVGKNTEDSITYPEIQSEQETDIGSNKEKILRLHQEGKSNVVIARSLGLGIGEVKLILDLFENGEK